MLFFTKFYISLTDVATKETDRCLRLSFMQRVQYTDSHDPRKVLKVKKIQAWKTLECVDVALESHGIFFQLG